jgi:hypothetical protein
VKRRNQFLLCVLYGGNTSCTASGINDQKHLSEQVKQHETSVVHTDNDVKVKFLGSTNISAQLNDGYHASIQHNSTVGMIINCIKFCGIHN